MTACDRSVDLVIVGSGGAAGRSIECPPFDARALVNIDGGTAF